MTVQLTKSPVCRRHRSSTGSSGRLPHLKPVSHVIARKTADGTGPRHSVYLSRSRASGGGAVFLGDITHLLSPRLKAQDWFDT